MSFLDIIREGGFIMYPLLIFSVLVWAVAIQKFLFLQNFSKQAKHYHDEALRIISSKRFNEMEWLYKNCSELIASPHAAVFEDSATKEEQVEKMNRRISETISGLKKHLWILGTIGSSAPFVGLFGTVVGIMGSFKAIGVAGKSGFAVVAASISEALIATASGIIVAVVAVIFYNYFQVRINEIAMDFRNKLGDMADQFNSSKK